MKVPRSRTAQTKDILIGILFLNWLVALLKIIFGVSSRCASMAADGFHSLSDGASNVIGLVGIHLAAKPKDIDHPYGHKKFETFFSLGIALLLCIVAFNLFKEGLARFSNPVSPQVNTMSFLVMIFTMAINIGVMRYEHKKGRLLQSDLLVADSLHTRADIFVSCSVIITLVFIGFGYPLLDAVATILISFFIAFSAFEIAKNSSEILCDKVAIVDTKKVVDLVLTIPGVMTCHKIRTRGRQDDIYIDLHVQVRPDMHVGEAHEVSYKIEEAIKQGIAGVTDVVVHIEPKEELQL
ncbi:MAG: cation transporter [Candidatus Omnitrophota bacterium]|jgi:cation diffusion facilitator family transporter|nr:MAG: cation transporter [Candidatus Omnitrophota bacterium]